MGTTRSRSKQKCYFDRSLFDGREKKKRNKRSIRDCPNKPSSFLYEFELSEKRNESLSTKYTLRGKKFTVFFNGKDLGNQ